ncbi:hypothetical protein ZTR_04819 [Talaromyces verruculosus]|nr:hypothetical protein ZTR_04819 [Talaromyces verruculosus]
MVSNKALIYKKLPTHNPLVGEHIQVEPLPDFDLNQHIPAGSAIVKALYFSCDPYMRGRMRPPTRSSYSPPFEIGKPISAYALVQVLRLSDDGQESITTSKGVTYGAGDILFGIFDIAEYILLGKELAQNPYINKIENPLNLPLSNFLSIMGMTGLTAYSSLYEIGHPKKGETIFISSAAGAVGQIVGQIAKREGLRVIGSVGDDAKLDFIVNELGFDGGFNYKKEPSVLEALQRLAPDGVDIYYENVGGEQLEAAIECMNVFGRIVASGMVSQYNLAIDDRYPIKNIIQMVPKRIRFQGFLVNDPDFGPKYIKERDERVPQWLVEGSIKTKEHIDEGIDSAGTAFVNMLEGKNFGKAIIHVADPE